MERITLKTQPREAKINPEDLRAESIVPAVIYGGERKEALSLQVDRSDLLKILKRINGSTLINIEIEGKISPALVGEIQYHPITEEILHIDFRQVDMKVPVKSWIDLNFTGESYAVKVLGGLLVQNRDRIHVQALPDALVDTIEVDTSKIKDFEHGLHISDLDLPEGVELLDEPTASIAIVRKPKTQAQVDADLADPVDEKQITDEEGKEGAEGDVDAEKKEETPSEK